jgi:hypothetical protein
VIRSIKEGEIDLLDYRGFADAYTALDHFVDQVYQYKRIGIPLGAALGCLTPAAFDPHWQQRYVISPLNLT